MAAAETQKNHPEYYRLKPEDPSFETLVTKCLEPFEKNGQKSQLKTGLTALTEDRIQVFNNGDRPFSPASKEYRGTFVAEARTLITKYCSGLVNAGDEIIEERKQEFFNVFEIAPKLISIMVSNQNYIQYVQRAQALELLKAALHLARYPETDMRILVGVGGSDSAFTNTRFPAYVVPALEVATQISEFYTARKKEKLESPAISKAFDEEAQKIGRPLTKDERREVSAKIKPNEDGKFPNLTEEEERLAVKEYGIRTSPIKIKYFSAHHAAIAINHTKDPHAIVIRAQENQKVIKDFIELHYPSQAAAVEYQQDTPWEQLKPRSRLVIDYLARLTRSSRDNAVKETLAKLEKLGAKQGGDNGRQFSAEYAAIHPIIFDDLLDLPKTRYMTGSPELPVINMTIGGRPERHFCAVREFLSSNATAKGFIEFLKQRMSTNPTEEAFLSRTLEVVKRWQRRRDFVAKQFKFESLNGSPRNPKIEVALITSIGTKPTYYTTGFDKPFGTPVDEHLTYLAKIEATLHYTYVQFLDHDDLEEGDANTKDDNTPENIEKRKLVHARSILQGVRHDLEVIKKVTEKTATKNPARGEIVFA